MKSPKFRLRKEDLAKIITESNIKITWKKVVRDAMRRQFIEDPVEFLDINLNLDSVARNLTTKVMNGDYAPLAPVRILSEKSRGLCRQIAVPHPHDALLLQCLSNSLFPALKASAPHENAYYQPDRGFNGKTANKVGYSGLQAWLDFQKKILEFSKTRPVLVVTDVANYYDTISYSQMRNIISNFIPEQKEALLDLMSHILSAMLWQPDYMPRVEVGLPQIDLDAPRLVAHTFLYELDRFVSTTHNVDYARFMDDMDIGLDSVDAAKRMLRDIDLTLHSRQIRLNSGKTKILSGPEIDHHFRVKENLLVSKLIDFGNANPTKIDRTRRLNKYLIQRGLRYKWFDVGNGEKVLKRLINHACSIGSILPGKSVQQLLRYRPAIREEVIRYICRVQGGTRYLSILTSFVKDTLVVDDAVALLFGYSIVQMRIPKSLKIRKRMAAIAIEMCKGPKSISWTYAALFILSKYGTEQDIWDAISKTYRQWQPNYHLGRLVAALKVVVIARRDELELLIQSSRNHGAAEVGEFLDAIALDAKKLNGILSYLKAPNPSYPNKITHAKWLVLINVLGSTTIPLPLRNTLRKIHSSAFLDYHYELKARAVT